MPHIHYAASAKTQGAKKSIGKKSAGKKSAVSQGANKNFSKKAISLIETHLNIREIVRITNLMRVKHVIARQTKLEVVLVKRLCNMKRLQFKKLNKILANAI